MISLALSVPNQFNPALVQQLARVIDPHKRNTQGNLITQEINKTLNNIPGLSRLLPEQVDAYGNPIERYDGGVASDIFNSFINPITTTKRKDSDVASEIERLEELTGETLIPGTVKKSIEYGGKNIPLSNKEQSEWNKTVGGNFTESVNNLISSKEYGEMSDEQKAKAISKIKEYYNAVYKYDFIKKNEDGSANASLDTEYREIQEATKNGFTTEQYISTKTVINDMETQDEKRSYILNRKDLSSEAIVYAMESYNLVSESRINDMNTALADYGVSKKDFCDIYAEFLKINNDNGVTNDGKRMLALAYLDSKIPGNDDTSVSQKEFLWDKLFNDGFWIENEKIPDFTADLDGQFSSIDSKSFEEVWNSGKWGTDPAKNLGYSVDEFAALVGYVSSGANKDEKVQLADSLNVSASVKSSILAAAGAKPNVSFSNGGSIDIESITKVSENKAEEKQSYETSDSMTPMEAIRHKNSGTLSYIKSNYAPMVGKYEQTSNFGMRTHPISGKYKMHSGIDLAPRGDTSTPAATAIKSGKVVGVNTMGSGYGNNITIETEDGYRVSYAHLDSVDSNLKAGDTVKAGQQIGVVGSTGNSTGNHLHVEVSKDGKKIDPNTYFDFNNDGLLQGTGNSSYSGTSGASSSGSSGSSSGSSGSSGYSGSSSGTIARSVARRRRRIGSGSAYGYSGYSGYTGY